MINIVTICYYYCYFYITFISQFLFMSDYTSVGLMTRAKCRQAFLQSGQISFQQLHLGSRSPANCNSLRRKSSNKPNRLTVLLCSLSMRWRESPEEMRELPQEGFLDGAAVLSTFKRSVLPPL